MFSLFSRPPFVILWSILLIAWRLGSFGAQSYVDITKEIELEACNKKEKYQYQIETTTFDLYKVNDVDACVLSPEALEIGRLVQITLVNMRYG